ncbi:MAG: hypothetical protein ACOZF2_06765 [Thermodesulfobacteriota bacterium]
MGTSSARRPPTTWLWRRAKGGASRYLAPSGGLGLEAREVVARYLAALGDETRAGSPNLLGSFRLTRKAGQNLGAFVGEVTSQGWDAALGVWGLTGGTEPPGAMAATALAGALLEAEGSLEDAVAHSALGAVLQDFQSGKLVTSVQVVARFLAESLYQRLVLDLGESLEAASGSYGHWRQGLEGLREWIIRAGTLEEWEDPPTASQWRGLAGWQRVTLALEKMLGRLMESSSEISGKSD